MKKEFLGLTVDHVQADAYKAEIDSVQVRQTVKTIYPSIQLRSSALDLFGAEAFNIPEKEYESIRVTWIQAPKGTTAEQVVELLAQKGGGHIQRKLSNNVMDVLTDGQRSMVEQNLQINDRPALEVFEENLRIRDRNGDELEGPAQYAQNFFTLTVVDDVDVRTYKGANARQVEQSQDAVESFKGANLPGANVTIL